MFLYDYYMWLFLNAKFMAPAKMIARNDQLESLMKFYGMKMPTICKP